MKAHIRITRPTNKMQAIIRFYRDGLGLEKINHYEDPNGFESILFGKKGMDYHLEFTHEKGHVVKDAPSDENMLVFYIPDQDEWFEIIERMERAGFNPVKPYNPSWEKKGVTFCDCEGYRVVLQNCMWQT